MKTGSRWLSVTLFSSESVVSIDVQAGEREKNDVLAPNTKRSRSSKVSGSFNILYAASRPQSAAGWNAFYL